MADLGRQTPVKDQLVRAAARGLDHFDGGSLAFELGDEHRSGFVAAQVLLQREQAVDHLAFPLLGAFGWCSGPVFAAQFETIV
jgi:hypothetical protein